MIGKCKLCGKEFNSRRACHCHLMTTHGDVYRKAGLKQEQFIDYFSDGKIASATSGQMAAAGIYSQVHKPAGLRHLNMNNRTEAAAAAEIDDEYNEPYEYIDNDQNVYTEAELIKKGWL